MRMSEGYPSDWNSRRREVYQRDNYTCQNCGNRGGPHGNAELHAHHVVPKKDGGTDKKRNLQTLCRDCHDAIHHKDKMAPTHFPNKGNRTITTQSGREAKEILEYIEKVNKSSSELAEKKSSISGIISESTNNLRQILELAKKTRLAGESELSSEGEQNRLFNSYIENQTEFRKEILELKLIAHGIGNISHPTEELEQLFSEYERGINEFIDASEGIHEHLDEYVEISTDSISINTETSEVAEDREKMKSATEKLESVSNEISERLSLQKLSMSIDFYSHDE